MQAPIHIDARHTAIRMDSVWMMLSQGETGKQGEKNILQSLKQICRAHKLPIVNDKHKMMKSILGNSNASLTLLNGYTALHKLNQHALERGSDALPYNVAIPVNYIDHKCHT